MSPIPVSPQAITRTSARPSQLASAKDGNDTAVVTLHDSVHGAHDVDRAVDIAQQGLSRRHIGVDLAPVHEFLDLRDKGRTGPGAILDGFEAEAFDQRFQMRAAIILVPWHTPVYMQQRLFEEGG